MKKLSFIKLFFAMMLLSVGLFIFFKDVDIDNLKRELKATSVQALIGGCCFIILSFYFRLVRWKILLPKVNNTHKKFLFGNLWISFMVNNIFPARIGEVVRIFILWKKNNFPISIGLGCLIIERMLDIFVFLSFFTVSVLILPQCSDMKIYAFLTLSIIIIVILLSIISVIFQSTAAKLGNLIILKLPEKIRMKTIKIAKEVSSTLGWLYSIKKVVLVLGYSVCVGLCGACIIILLAQNTTIAFGLPEGLLIQFYAAVGAAIPLSPGYIGTLHAAMLQGLNLIGMNSDKARAVAIMYHGLNYIVVNIVGFFFILKLKISFKEIFSANQKIKSE